MKMAVPAAAALHALRLEEAEEEEAVLLAPATARGAEAADGRSTGFTKDSEARVKPVTDAAALPTASSALRCWRRLSLQVLGMVAGGVCR
mmetsp:Transcript_36986/g.86686  ORF Transcript_36986/g.86686 Transcript_36986/m.86686 type:complete len:90 (-) Transcript_36986:60-329(-)